MVLNPRTVGRGLLQTADLYSQPREGVGQSDGVNSCAIFPAGNYETAVQETTCCPEGDPNGSSYVPACETQGQ